MALHTVRGRPKVPVVPCKFCSRQFKRQEHLQRHLRTHTQERPFACFCGQAFARRDLLARHERISHPRHADDPPSLACESDCQPSDSSESRGGQQLPTCSQPVSSQPDSSLAFPSWAVDGGGPTATTLPPFSAAGDAPAVDMFPTGSFDLDILWTQADMVGTYLTTAFPADELGPPPYHPQENLPRVPIEQAMPGDSDMAYSNSVSSAFSAGTHATSTNGSPPGIATSGGPSPSRPLDARVTRAQSARPKRALRSSVSDSGRRSGPADGFASGDAGSDTRLITPWALSATAYANVVRAVGQCRDAMPPGFVLPARSILTRYLVSYFRGFHPHLPFFHLPTANPETMPAYLLLQLTGSGAFYAFEHPQGFALYLAGKAVFVRAMERKRQDEMLHLTRSYPTYAALAAGAGPHTHSMSVSTGTDASPDPSAGPVQANHKREDLEIMQTLLVMVMMSAWVDQPALYDSFAMASELATVMREKFLLATTAPKSTAPPEPDWKQWCLEEEIRRTIYCAYIVFGLQAICFNTPPPIVNSDLRLVLPCSADEWAAADAASWTRVRRTGRLRDVLFPDCLRQLLSGQPLDRDVCVTAFGNYVLIHGLMQQIAVERSTSQCLLLGVGGAGHGPAALPRPTLELHAAALHAWQTCWHAAAESTLDPACPHGPLGFNATAMLRLAHVYLTVGMDGYCRLRSRDPAVLAAPFLDEDAALVGLRGVHLEQAILHCAYALSIPVRAGIAFVARTQTGHWSVQHALSNFACALLLVRWLESMARMVEGAAGVAGVADDTAVPLRRGERQLLHMITCLVQETSFAGSLGDDEAEENRNGDGDGGQQAIRPARIRSLAVAAVKIWAETCQGIQVFEIVHVIGATLALCAKRLEERNAAG